MPLFSDQPRGPLEKGVSKRKPKKEKKGGPAAHFPPPNQFPSKQVEKENAIDKRGKTHRFKSGRPGVELKITAERREITRLNQEKKELEEEKERLRKELDKRPEEPKVVERDDVDPFSMIEI